ncbi:MAG TPA: DinB family protein [Acidimicrobiales bacterium]|nr:DinB family protein [Acidimicrobiales bacterium]
MNLDWTQLAPDQLDWHWHAQLRPRLDGLTDDEYFWEPVPGCWSIRLREDATTPLAAGAGDWVADFEFPTPVPAPLTTIAWRLGHVILMFGHRAGNHFGGEVFEPHLMTWPSTADAALRMLDEQYARWMSGVASLGEEGMARAVGPAEGQFADSPYATLVLHLNREAIHHGAELALLRDLYARRTA